MATHIPYVNGIEFNSSAGHPSAMGDGQRMMARHGADMVGMGEGPQALSMIPQETTIRSMHVNAACNRYWSGARLAQRSPREHDPQTAHANCLVHLRR